MNDALATYLRSMRTLSQSDVDTIAHDRDAQHMSGSERFDMVAHGTPLGGSEH